jgi:hypothetical protein
MRQNRFFAELALKIIKLFDQNLRNCSDRSGANECTSCRCRKMLENENLLAQIGVDTAEKEPGAGV